MRWQAGSYDPFLGDTASIKITFRLHLLAQPRYARAFLIKGGFYVKEGDKVLIPRTSGDFTPGTIIFVHGEKALVEFPIGLTFKGKPAPAECQNKMGTKVVNINKLRSLEV
jgi:hypothetical protein